MSKLIAGYRRFRSDVYPVKKQSFKRLARSQKPHTLFITCSDSRVVPSMITQTEPGELFICRAIGNLIPAHGVALGGVTSAIEYAVCVLEVEQIVVCGHSDCGAMRAFLHPEKLESLKSVRSWLEHASTAITVAREQHSHLQGEEFVEALVRENVISQLQHLRTHPCVAAGLRKGSLDINGWYYDIGEGLLTRYEDDRHEFVALDENFREEMEPVIA
jgi:carbonic anhydrase